MIDCESQVFQKVADAFRAVYPDGFIAGEYVAQPPKFPAVSLVEMENYVNRRGRDSGDIENFADVMYEANVYSNKVIGKKAECRAIAALIDEQMSALGFTRSFLNPIQNMNDATIYRMTGRWIATVGKDDFVYRR